VGVTYITTRDIPLADLTKFPGNPRRGNVDQIAASIRRHGQYRSLVVRDEGTQKVILAGNHTYEALKAQGNLTARCELILCTDDEARRINLADNRLAELGTYDNDELVELLSYLEDDYDGTGWTEEDVSFLIHPEGNEPPERRTDPDTVPNVPSEPVSKPGDLWHLGPHRILCGDATDTAAVEAMLAEDLADCMWTDPPYGVEYVGKTKNALTISNDSSGSLPELLAGAFAVATVALQPAAPVYIAHPPGALSLLFAAAIQNAGWSLRQQLVWVKDSLVLGHNDYHYRHEPIWMAYTDGGKGRRGRGGNNWHGDNTQTSVFEIPKPSRSEDHPTMKPVELVATMITNSCPQGGLVYDPFGGSGTTLIAAHTLNMRAALVELDPRYVDVVCRRYQGFTGEPPTLAGQTHDFHPE
jgi:DNA modification methylase